MDGHPIRGLITILVLMIVNAIVSAMVTAFENVSEATAEKRAEEGERRAKLVVYLLNHHRRYITVTDLISVSAIAGMTVTYYRNLLFAMQQQLQNGDLHNLVRIVLLVLITILSIMLVELLSIKLPKKIAFKHAESYAYSLAGLLRFFTKLLAFPAWVLERVTIGILALFHIKASELEDNVTEEELISSVTEAQEQGILEAEEAEMIHNIFTFGEKEVNDIMTHRRSIVAISEDMTVPEAMDFMLNEPFSRFPVYEESVENIIGVLHLKDVMTLCNSESTEVLSNRTVREVAREPYFVPDTQNLDVLFHEMQKRKLHMAIAIDEYGQTAGIITMEDILEEIVGDIQDEYDEEEEDIIEQPDGSFLVRGMVDLEDLAEQTKMRIDEDDYDTLNGLLISQLNYIPTDNEHPTVFYNGFQIDVLETKNKMIELTRVTRLPEKTEEEETNGKEAAYEAETDAATEK